MNAAAVEREPKAVLADADPRVEHHLSANGAVLQRHIGANDRVVANDNVCSHSTERPNATPFANLMTQNDNPHIHIGTQNTD